jgi:hypothetical protein
VYKQQQSAETGALQTGSGMIIWDSQGSTWYYQHLRLHDQAAQTGLAIVMYSKQRMRLCRQLQWQQLERLKQALAGEIIPSPTYRMLAPCVVKKKRPRLVGHSLPAPDKRSVGTP